MLIFAAPWMALLLVLPVLMRVLRPAANKSKAALAAPEISFPHIERLQAIFPRQQQKRTSSWFQTGVLGLLWLCLTLTLMRPEFLDQYTQLGTKGYDLMMAIDLSGSMRALDYEQLGQRVSRLDVVKTVVESFVQQRKGDRVGLLLFGSDAYLHVPLTLDTLSVSKMLDNTTVGEAGDATAIGDAIGLAVGNLRDRPENSRVIILMTDGADNASTIPPLEAANLARLYGIRVYTIGVGTDGLVPAPDANGKIVMAQSDLDETLLKKIAETTGGTYSRASDIDAMRQIYERINSLEKTDAEQRSFVIPRPMYRYPLGLALFLLLVYSLFPVVAKARHGF